MDESESKAVQAVLEGGWLAEGKVTEAFEERVRKYVGAGYAVATANCTVALELALKAYLGFNTGLIRGARIATSDFGHPASIQAIMNAGFLPILCDVDLATYNLHYENLEEHWLLPISWGGNPSFYADNISMLVEDAACSLGAKRELASGHMERVGELYPTCFSFHPRKLITTGEGGIVTTNDAALTQRIRELKNFGEGGGNYKFDDVRAAIGLTQMDKLERIIERRIKMAKIYEDLLKPFPWIKPPQKHPQSRHTFQTYAVYLERGNRDKIIVKLAEKGIETQIGAYALHLLPQFKDVECVGSLKNSELLHRNLLALPMAYSLTDEDQKFVVDELSKTIHN